MRETGVFAAILALPLLAACAGPVLDLSTDTPDSRLLLDGRPVGTGEAQQRQPYYGTLRLEAVPPVRTRPDQTRRAAAVVDHDARPPFTDWIFPLDFVLETVTAPFRDRHTTVHLPLPVIDPVPTDAPPAGLEQLRASERAARMSR